MGGFDSRDKEESVDWTVMERRKEWKKDGGSVIMESE